MDDDSERCGRWGIGRMVIVYFTCGSANGAVGNRCRDGEDVSLTQVVVDLGVEEERNVSQRRKFVAASLATLSYFR